MNKKLKLAIITYIVEHEKEFQLKNVTREAFRDYIYDKQGEYLIGGEDVSDFIDNAIKLLIG